MGKCSKCKLPGGNQNFHVCVDLSYRAPGEAQIQRNVWTRRKKRTDDDARGGFHNFGSQFARPRRAGTDVNEHALYG